MPGNYLEAVRKAGQAVNPLFAFLGMVVVEIGPERAVLDLPFRQEFLQGAGAVAGGIIAALADEAMAHVVLANLGQAEKTATIEMTMRYFRPVLSNGLIATATLVNKGRRIISAEALVTDDAGRLVGKAGGSFFVIAHSGSKAG
ncbi:MAG: PaaI family thioesterase [Acidobacteriota bacterium]